MAFTYGAGGTHLVTSPGLWEDLDEDFHRGGIRQLEFGADGAVWGVKAWRDYNQPSPQHQQPQGGTLRRVQSETQRTYTVMEEPFGTVPDSLFEKAAELYPSLTHYDEVDFVAVGYEGSWVMGVKGQFVFWDKIEAKVIKHLTTAWQTAGAIRVRYHLPLLAF